MTFDLKSRQYVYDPVTRVWARAGFSSIAYNDGDAIEQRVFESVSRVKDVSSLSPELAATITDWASLYHLSPMRGNLLRPLKHLLHGKVLEIGAGCGAITRFMGETGAQVLALEGSAVRARIAASRCRDLENVTVMADAFHNFTPEPAFDVVTLIGVLEYARKYFPSTTKDPVDAMLDHARAMLRPGGVLIVAIENQLGLKYFAGYAEDHVGVAMYGLEDQYRPGEVVTFGREELKARVKGAGLSHQQWWFPFPDYKLPASLLSERAVDEEIGIDLAPMLASAAAIDPQRPGALFFSLESVWKPILRNRLAGHLANSFLVLASDNKKSIPKADAVAYHYAVKRLPAFAKEVAFREAEKNRIEVEQTLLYPDVALPPNIPLRIKLDGKQPYFSGKQWKMRLMEILNVPGWKLADLEAWSAVWFECLLEKSGLTVEKGALTAHSKLPGVFLDLLPRNLIRGADGVCHVFDQEWELPVPLELGYLLFRGVLLEMAEISAVAPPVVGTPNSWVDIFYAITKSLGAPVATQDLIRYATMETDFQTWVTGISRPSMLPWLLSRSLPIRFPVMAERQALIQQLTALQRKAAGC